MKRRRLAERRKALGLSQEQLAEILGVDPTTIGRWERAHTDPQPWFRPRLAKALRLSVDELIALLEEGRTAPNAVPDVLQASSADLLRMGSFEGADGRDPSARQQTLMRGITMVAAASRLLEGHLPAGSRRLGVNDVARIHAVINLYHSVDREYGGGRLYEDVARFAESASSLLAQSYADSLAPSLFRSVSAARLLAGWTAFDACRHLDAQRHFQSAESTAVASGDLPNAARVRYCQARQLQHLRHNQDALDRTCLAQAQLGASATPALSAMLSATAATSLAALGDNRGALLALGEARDAFDRIDPAKEPEWMGFYDQGELLAQYGRVYRDFARVDRSQGQAALPWVQQALPAYSPQSVRSAVLGEVSLCSSYFLADAPDEGLRIGIQVIQQAKQLSSPRIFDRIRNVQRDLTRHIHISAVADFAQELRTIKPLDLA